MGFVENVKNTIRKYSMLKRGGQKTVLVGLSGGPDSVALLRVLDELSEDYGNTLHAVYVEHGLRPSETPAEIEFARSLCKQLDVPFTVRAVDVKGLCRSEKRGIQEAARRLRYEAYEAEARRIKAGSVALGHTADDQAETFMMRVLRGSGTAGMGAIPPVRGPYIRPLIETTRREILEYLEHKGAAFVTDPTNMDDKYLRNRIRHRLMPVLNELNPNIVETLLWNSEVMRDEDRYMETVVNKTLMRLITRKSDNSIELFLSPLEAMDKAVLRRVIRRAVRETEGLGGIAFRHIEDIAGLIKDSAPGAMITLPGDIRAIKKYSTLLVTTEPQAKLKERELTPPGDVMLKEAGLMIRATIEDHPPHHLPPHGTDDGKRRAVFDLDRVKTPLVIRARQEGDSMRPAGLGGTKKLQDLFVDEKVPRHERDTVPVVTTAGGDVLWAAGVRADEIFLAGEGTKRFLVLELMVIDA